LKPSECRVRAGRTYAELGVSEALSNLELLVTNNTDIVYWTNLRCENLIEIFLLGSSREISHEYTIGSVAIASDGHINKDMLSIDFCAVGGESLSACLDS
jgi:hypothetical protein